jgi:thymidylate synthase (FAD)
MKIRVLDRGFVELVDHMGNDLTVVNAARVSFNNGSREFNEKDIKLLSYLAKHNHWTPFAHPQITLRIKAPISIRTQFYKHKQGFVENEISRRYVSYEPEVYIPDWRSKPTDGAKQGSEKRIESDLTRDMCGEAYSKAQECLDSYNRLIGLGVAPEQARFVLPQGTYTEWWWTGSLAAYARFYKQRIDPHAQWEIQEYAKAVGQILSNLYPESWKVLNPS